VALLRVEDAPRVRHACRYAIDEKFGPFDVGLGERGVGVTAAI
jgi:hypothetical protein